MKFSLPSSISSPQDLRALLMEIRAFVKWSQQVKTKAQVSKSAAKAEPMTISETAAELIKQATSGEGSGDNSVDELIAWLENLDAHSPKVVITLAGLAPGSLRASLLEWCRKNLGPDVLLELRFNATILGGMVVQYGSHIYDWSFRRAILANRDKFPEILRNV